MCLRLRTAHDVDHESYLQRRSRKIKGCNGRCSHPVGDLSWPNAKSGCSGMVCLFLHYGMLDVGYALCRCSERVLQYAVCLNVASRTWGPGVCCGDIEAQGIAIWLPCFGYQARTVFMAQILKSGWMWIGDNRPCAGSQLAIATASSSCSENTAYRSKKSGYKSRFWEIENVEVRPMLFWIASAAGLVIAYLLGSTPTGYLAGKLLKSIDIREHGSKSTGATNVLRTLGKWAALVVLIVDVLKGVAAIIVARGSILGSIQRYQPRHRQRLIYNTVPWAVSLAGIAVLFGHSRSIWLNFTGGKSAATGLGVLLAMSWPVGLGAATVFGIALAIARIVSLARYRCVDSNRSRVRIRASITVSIAGDRRRLLRDRPSSRQHSKAISRDGATSGSKSPGYESRSAGLA